MTLFAEDGQILATTLAPATKILPGDFRGFEGYVVDVDEECSVAELPTPQEEAAKKPKSTLLYRWEKIKSCGDDKVKGRLKNQPLFPKQRTDAEILDCFLNPQKEKSEMVPEESRKIVGRLTTECRKFRVPFLRNEIRDPEILDLRFVLDGEQPKRSCSTPERFSSLVEFRQCWKLALQEEMQIKMDGFGLRMQSILQKTSELRQGLRDGLKRAGIEYYENCKVEKFKKKGVVDSLFLTLEKIPDQVKKTWRRQDAWIVSTDPRFLFEWFRDGKKRVIDHLKGPWTLVFCSLWHQPSKDGRLQVQLISKDLPTDFLNSNKLYGVHGPPLTFEMNLWEALEDMESIPTPLLETLLSWSPSQQAPCIFPRELASQVNQLVTRFRLNSSQKEVLKPVSQWLLKESSNQSICLIHGPFGSGKSSLLITIIHLLTTMERKLRVLVCAHTNLAVDRLLQGLLDSGFEDFIRIGSLGKIAKPLLKYSLHSSDSERSDVISELRKQLQSLSSPSDESFLRSELDLAMQGHLQRRKEHLASVNVVGVTCCSVGNQFLSEQVFDVVLLDECSQIIEPLSLLPLIKSKAKYLIAAGDPCQLPPVISSPSKHDQGLMKTLFSRLHSIGHPVCFLDTQYRCHPMLCEVPNKHFYGMQLKTGCSVEDRCALISQWPPLCHLQVEGKSQTDKFSRSRWNKEEADAVIQLLCQLTVEGLSSDQLGVICFFRAQVSLIKAGITKTIAEAVQVATVDSFQGMEKDVVVLSMSVDASDSFASDNQRLNVALTRARHHLILVGDKRILQSISPCLHDLFQLTRTMPLIK